MAEHKRSCDTCFHVHAQKNVKTAEITYECHRNPPMAVPIIGADDDGNPRLVGCLSTYVPVNPAYPCGEYKFTIALPPGATRN